MQYDQIETLKEFNRLMVDIRKTIPQEYDAFIKGKESLIASNKLQEKTKWLLLLVASVSQKCPICIPKAVEHCMANGWCKEELLEACMVAVLVGGSSVMTYVTLAAKTMEDIANKSK